MRPNIKFDLIGLKLAEISSLKINIFASPKKLSKPVVYKLVKSGHRTSKNAIWALFRVLYGASIHMLNHMNNNGVARTRSRHELARYF